MDHIFDAIWELRSHGMPRDIVRNIIVRSMAWFRMKVQHPKKCNDWISHYPGQLCIEIQADMKGKVLKKYTENNKMEIHNLLFGF